MRQLSFKETWNKCLREQIAALRGTRTLAVYLILSRVLRSVRLWRMNNALQRIYSTDTPFTGALYLARRLIPCFLKFLSCSLLIFSLHANAAMSDINRIYKQVPVLDGFDICMGGGCAEVKHVALSNDEWQSIASIFKNVGNITDAAQERSLIAQAIGAFESKVGTKTSTANDRAGTFGNSGYPGQLDCNDEAINTTTYMRLMRQNGLIKFHEIEDTRTRNFFFNGWPHSTAVIHETATGARFAVDSWFYDNGFPATIVPFAVWKSGYIPEDSPVLRK